MAFVLVQHLDPKRDSLLTEILSRSTTMPIREVRGGMRVQINNVYVIPANADIGLVAGSFRLTKRATGRGREMPIDHFMLSMAEQYKSRAIGVVLSGTLSDGAHGLRAIKAEGGVTFAQDEASARFKDMPRAAIAAGAVDFVHPPEKIALELVHMARHPYLRPVPAHVAGVPRRRRGLGSPTCAPHPPHDDGRRFFELPSDDRQTPDRPAHGPAQGREPPQVHRALAEGSRGSARPSRGHPDHGHGVLSGSGSFSEPAAHRLSVFPQRPRRERSDPDLGPGLLHGRRGLLPGDRALRDAGRVGQAPDGPDLRHRRLGLGDRQGEGRRLPGERHGRRVARATPPVLPARPTAAGRSPRPFATSASSRARTSRPIRRSPTWIWSAAAIC